MIGPEVENGYQFDVARVRAWLIYDALHGDPRHVIDLADFAGTREARLGFRWSRSLDAAHDALEEEWRRLVPGDAGLIEGCRSAFERSGDRARRDRRPFFMKAPYWLVHFHAEQVLREIESGHGKARLAAEMHRFEGGAAAEAAGFS